VVWRVNCTFVLLESVNVVLTVFTKLILRWSDIERQTKLFEWCISKISFHDCLISSGQIKLFEWCTFPKSAITIFWWYREIKWIVRMMYFQNQLLRLSDIKWTKYKIHCLNYVFPKSNITIVWYRETKLIVRMVYLQKSAIAIVWYKRQNELFWMLYLQNHAAIR